MEWFWKSAFIFRILRSASSSLGIEDTGGGQRLSPTGPESGLLLDSKYEVQADVENITTVWRNSTTVLKTVALLKNSLTVV